MKYQGREKYQRYQMKSEPPDTFGTYPAFDTFKVLMLLAIKL